MAFPNLRRVIIVFLFIVLALSACQNPSTLPATSLPVMEFHETPDFGQAYTSTKYNFTIEYPPGWQFRELSVLQGSTPQHEVWFSAEEFPPTNTGARPDLTLVITEQDPFARWGQEHFDEYRSEIIQIGDGTAVRITGVNKESLQEETVVIIKLNDVYLEMLPGQGAQALEAFDKIVTTFSSPELQPANIPVTEIPAELLPAETAVPENTACIGPYFDPIALLPDNERLLLRSDTGIMVFNLNTLQAELVLEPPLQVMKAALSPDGGSLIWALEDHSMERIELPSGKMLNTLTGHTAMIVAMKFSHTGDRLYTASHDNSVKVWDFKEGLISEYYSDGGEVFGIGVSPDERRLVIVTFEGRQKLWDIQKNELISEIGVSGAFDGSDASFSPDGQIVGIGLGGGPVSLWDVQEGARLWEGGNHALALSQTEDLMAYSDMDKSGNHWIFVRSLDDRRHIHALRAHNSLIWKVFFSPGGSLLVSAAGTEILIWQMSYGKLLYNLVPSCS